MMLRGRPLFLHCNKKGIDLAHFVAGGTFSLAMALHLAIMSGQLGNVWDARFQKRKWNDRVAL
jgi:hypothetical protein